MLLLLDVCAGEMGSGLVPPVKALLSANPVIDEAVPCARWQVVQVTIESALVALLARRNDGNWAAPLHVPLAGLYGPISGLHGTGPPYFGLFQKVYGISVRWRYLVIPHGFELGIDLAPLDG